MRTYTEYIRKTKTQNNIATSLAESKVITMFDAASKSIGIVGHVHGLCMKAEQTYVNVNTSATMEIASRDGLGRTRHIDIVILWLWQKQLQHIRDDW